MLILHRGRGVGSELTATWVNCYSPAEFIDPVTPPGKETSSINSPASRTAVRDQNYFGFCLHFGATGDCRLVLQ